MRHARRQVVKKNEGENMRIVVVGDGKIGKAVTERLSSEGHDLVVIDSREAPLTESSNAMDVMAVCGNGASRDVQMEAGVPQADLLIAATGGDELNLLCCLIAKKLGAKRTIARVRNPEYADQLPLIRDELGLSMSINPELAAAREIFSVLRFPAVLTVEQFAKGRAELAEMRLPANSKLEGLRLYEIYQKFQIKVLICAVRRGEQVVIPKGDFTLQEGDSISFMAAPAELERFMHTAGIPIHRLQNVLLVGGGRIAYYLTRMLGTIGVHPTIIEKEPERCRALSEAFPDSLIIQGDGTDQELLREESLQTADAFVALTGMDEENILLSMYATSQGASKVVTKVSRSSMLGLVGGAVSDSIITPRNITANEISTYVRAMDNSTGSNVETLYRIVGGAVEALEFRVRGSDEALVNIPLKDMRLKPELLIGCIIRNGRVIIPGGEDCIKTDDRVVVVTTDMHLNDLHDILAL